MAVTIRDVAKRANVSHMTVSRVLSRRAGSYIADATRQRVEEAAKEMGYRPNQFARTLVTGRSQTIGLWISRPYEAYYAKAFHLFQQQASRHGYQVLVRDASEFAGDRELFPDEWPVDGIITMDLVGFAAAHRRDIVSRKIPCVNVGNFAVADTDCVRVDTRVGTGEAVAHLVEIGCRRIALVMNDMGEAGNTADERRTAYHAASIAAGLTPEYLLLETESRACARETVRNYVAQNGCPDGLFCRNDELAIGTYRGLRDLGIAVPGDAALVGCDGIDDVEYLDPALSTIVQPLGEMCALAWQFLQERMKEPEMPPQQAVLQAHLQIRASSVR